ncbi:MAG: cation transporter [Chlorobi bacterium]|nr:cation transporter [Chlorobiota bacterium]
MGRERHHEVEGKNLFLTILLNAGICLAELIGGIISGSISLISDAIHNFSDVLSLIISYSANKLAKREATGKQTFGFKRSEILAAFLNSTTLIVLAFYILYKAVERLISPVDVSSSWVIWLALGSIAVNGLSVLFIKKDAEGNMNMKSAYLHLLGDMMTSVAVLIGGILMKYFHVYWIDPVFSILIAIYLIYLSWDIFMSSLKIMMQFAPEHIDINEINLNVSKIKGVGNIHHVHIWQINEHDIMFEAHIDLQENIKISDFEGILKSLKDHLRSEYDIHHITIQPEFSVDDNKQLIKS